MDDRVVRRNRWPVSLLLVGSAVRRSDRLHVWCAADPHFTLRAVAASSSASPRAAGFTITVCRPPQFASPVHIQRSLCPLGLAARRALPGSVREDFRRTWTGKLKRSIRNGDTYFSHCGYPDHYGP